MLELTTPLQKLAFGMVFAGIAAFLFLPIYWLVLTSFMPDKELYAGTLDIWPDAPTLVHYAKAFDNAKLWRYILNSVLAAGASALLTTILAAYAGFSFAKYKYFGRRAILFVMISAQMFPFAMLLISIYYMMQGWALLNTRVGLTLAYLALGLPAGTYLLYTYFERVPTELIESARIDGASDLRIIHSIIFPLAAPALLTVGLYCFMWAWNDLLFALTLIRSDDLRTIGPGLLIGYTGEHLDDWGGIMAASIVVSLPIVLVFSFLQKFFVQGLTAGAVKA